MGDSYSPSNSGRKRSHDDRDDDPTGKKQKNRDAARKCREKKVQETNELKKKNDELTKMNQGLSSRKKELEEKLLSCIKEIKKHKESGCTLPTEVENIISSSEICPQFIPVGTQITQRQSLGCRQVISSRGKTCQDDSDSDSHAEEAHTTITGLFTGKLYSTSGTGKSSSTNSTSRSPSRSPSTPPSSSNGKHMVCCSPPSTSQFPSNKNVNGASNLVLQPTWHHLHKRNEQMSPGLSPVQTVPNIDNEWYNVPDLHPKLNGFPDIDEAVRQAQEGPGLLDVSYNPPQNYHYHYPQNNTNSSQVKLPSTGFNTNYTTSLSSTASSSETFGSADIRSPQAISNVRSSLKPATSSSMTVSMNDTAQLLSQAIYYNFDASEISEDLKKQYAELAKNKEHKTTEEEPQCSHDYTTQTEQYNEVETVGIVEQGQIDSIAQTQVTTGGNQEISCDTVLNLAKDQQTMIVHYQGNEYTCSYEKVKQLIKCISDQQSAVQVIDSNTSSLPENCFSTLPANHTVMTNDLFNDTNDAPYFVTQPELTAMCEPALNNESFTVPVVAQASVDQPLVQSNQVPTTVLSMIEEDSQQSQIQPTEDSSAETYEDYGANLFDLPSLSLTEDDPNIFEKKRKHI